MSLILGPSLAQFQDLAYAALMRFYAEIGQTERSAVQRAMDTNKAAQARAFLSAGVRSTMLEEEARIRGLTVAQLAQQVDAAATQAEQLELARVACSQEVYAATDHQGVLAALKKRGIPLA